MIILLLSLIVFALLSNMLFYEFRVIKKDTKDLTEVYTNVKVRKYLKHK